MDTVLNHSSPALIYPTTRQTQRQPTNFRAPGCHSQAIPPKATALPQPDPQLRPYHTTSLIPTPERRNEQRCSRQECCPASTQYPVNLIFLLLHASSILSTSHISPHSQIPPNPPSAFLRVLRASALNWVRAPAPVRPILPPGSANSAPSVN